MVLDAGLTTGSGGVPLARRRPTTAARFFGPAATLVLLTALLLTGSPALAAAAQFVPAASSATWNGSVATVTFQEVGVAPDTATTIMVVAIGTTDAVCRQNGVVILTFRSSSTVTDQTDYPVGSDGTVSATREVGLVAQPPNVGGVDCVMEIVRRITVTLHDTRTGAVLTINGQVTPARTMA